MRTLLQDFYPDLETALVVLPIKPPVGRAMTQDEFFTFCQQNRKLPFERNAKGEVSLSPAYGVLGSFQISSIVYQLGTWANERKCRPGVAGLRARSGAGVAAVSCRPAPFIIARMGIAVKFTTLIPMRFNDGREVPQEKVNGIVDELTLQFSGCSDEGVTKGQLA